MQRLNFKYILILILYFMIGTQTNAQTWDDGMYHMGRQMMDWRGSASLDSLTGKVIIDTSMVTTFRMGNLRPANYYLDTVGNGSRNYQLFFGPYWYKPDNGTLKPADGQNVNLKGVLLNQMTPPMLVVYIIDGKLWRDTTGVASWSGNWIHRNNTDSTDIYCTTDSISFMNFPPNVMGNGMMGGGMFWPDSIFCQFEQMEPDSIQGANSENAFMGFHVNMYNPSGNFMMQMGNMNNGMMTMQRGVNMEFHIPNDSLTNRGLSLSQVKIKYLDNTGKWNDATVLSTNNSKNTVTIANANLYSFYIVTPQTVTSVEDNKILPSKFDLSQNYPNPFNPSTTISFQLPKSSFVTLKIYDVIGREVRTLINNEMNAGSYKTVFNFNGFASGVYFYKLKAGNFSQIKKMVLLK